MLIHRVATVAGWLVIVLLVTPSTMPDPVEPAPDVVERSISSLQTSMSHGEFLAVDLIDAYLARIEAYDRQEPALNAIIWVNPDARAEAARLDAERAERGPRGPLHGIPVILKDNYDMAGVPTTGGSAVLSTHVPATDAYQVRRLREAGAIILAKANLHELAYGITTVSSLGGQTRNPYDPSRNPGGSSGGTAAAIAASFATIGWGSDTCGSIRIPAAVNNLVGLRVTKGLSSIDGIMPLSTSQDVGGPLARTVADLAIGLDLTIGADPADTATRVLADRPPPRFEDALDAGALQGARIGALVQYFGTGPEEAETNRVVRDALEQMRAFGAEVVDVEIPDLESLLSGTSLIDLEFKWDLMSYLSRTPGTPVRSLADIIERELHHPAVDGVLRRSDRHERLDRDAWEETVRRRAELTRVLLEVLEQHRLDALAYPSIRREAARIGEPALGNNCQLSASTGTPALAIPAGFSSGGVPVGLELLGRPFDDARLLAIGFAFEQAVRPRRPPATTPALTAPQ